MDDARFVLFLIVKLREGMKVLDSKRSTGPRSFSKVKFIPKSWQ